MEAQEDKNKQSDPKEQVSALEEEMKSAFKEGGYEAVKAAADKIKALDPENHLAEKLMKKAEKVKEKEEKVAKTQKTKEYKVMLKTLFKDRDTEKLTALAKEFKDFDPESRNANKWILRAEKLKEKMSGKAEGVKEEKKEEVPVKIEAKTEVVMPVEAPKTPPAVAPAVVIPKKAPAEAKGNIFTKMFGKKEEETQKKSIIDTIVATTDKKEEEKVPEMVYKKPAEGKKGAGLLTFSKVFLNFAIIFIVLSAVFLYVEWVDKENRVLSLVGISENTGGKLHGASQDFSTLKRQEAILNKDIELYKGGYDDKALTTVETIVGERINWPDIFAKINEVTNSVYELNDFFKYIEYNNYSFDAENGTIRVTGTLSDPLGRNLTKLVELEEAFKFFPRDKNNPDDTTAPYFIGFREFTSFSKTLDPITGRYSSSFQLSFSLNE